MTKEFAHDGVRFVFLYTREAHPGERYGHHASFDQKLEHARAMVSRWNIARPMLVDDLAGTVHRAYGKLPNMTYIVARGGAIIYRANWTDPRTIRLALEQMRFETTQRSEHRVAPYFVEWSPARVNDREPFLAALRADAGERAVTEFIDASEKTYGEPTARSMRAWQKKT